MKSNIPKIAYDGGHIDVLWDNHEAALQWFEKYFGWKRQDESRAVTRDSNAAEMKETRLPFGTMLSSVITGKRLAHHHAERGTIDGHVRWCWKTRKLAETHEWFKAEGIRVSGIYSGPGGKDYFDFWATVEGIRLTAEGDPTGSSDHPRFVPSWVRIGVKDLYVSLAWYTTYLGAEVLEDRSKEGYVVLGLALEHHEEQSRWVLEQLPEDTETDKFDNPTRPYCVLHDLAEFESYHAFLRESGIPVSEIVGPGRFRFFHLYDPDGNRFNLYRY
ncbi:VOC family protein [Paenibacillus allorhizosphaerae]|uniref:VOC domain-containing protein n=1 Tax=Paenibacillus allorhizosphaerae TaxID=2849866 RepID=A0ABN7TKG2_9BACL|nr:VOC family protein [Paenibacillus allorhizosphaerae]CAG7643795.1 hypothetical protein PAECIP111802_03076 [Paenibacillus allorhizosphaerae]